VEEVACDEECRDLLLERDVDHLINRVVLLGESAVARERRAQVPVGRVQNLRSDHSVLLSSRMQYELSATGSGRPTHGRPAHAGTVPGTNGAPKADYRDVGCGLRCRASRVPRLTSGTSGRC